MAIRLTPIIKRGDMMTVKAQSTETVSPDGWSPELMSAFPNGGMFLNDETESCDLCGSVERSAEIVCCRNQTRLCRSCFNHLNRIPSFTQVRVEEFLIGNVC